MKRLLVLILLSTLAPAIRAADPFEFRDGDRVVLIGGTLIEREQRYGYWETVLTALHPYKDISFRNLGWSGDTVWGEAQARFGGPAEGFRHRQQHVTALHPTVIIIGYGLNESFAGPAGLPKFEQGLGTLLDSLAPTKARIVLLSPPRQEDAGRPLPDPAEQNKNIRRYTDALRETADKRGCHFVDLYELLGNEKERLTDNGLHMTDYGYWRSADVLARALCGQPLPVHGDIDTDQEKFTFKLPWLPPSPRPGRSDSISQVLTYQGLKPGNYTLLIDGKKTITALAADWGKGVKLPPALEVEQIEKLRQTIIEKNQTYFHRWRPQNETYLFLFRKGEQGQNAKEIPEFDPYVAGLEKEISELRVPAMHEYELAPK